MRAVAFGFEQTATFQDNHAEHQQKESDAYPINFFHSRKAVYIYKREYNQFAIIQTKFNQ